MYRSLRNPCLVVTMLCLGLWPAVVAAAGGRVAKHGNRAASSNSGASDVLDTLGINLEASPELVQRSIVEAGIGFLPAPMYHSAMRFVGPVRADLGIRTIFNLLGPLTNPAGAKRQVLGTSQPELTEKLAS